MGISVVCIKGKEVFWDGKKFCHVVYSFNSFRLRNEPERRKENIAVTAKGYFKEDE